MNMKADVVLMNPPYDSKNIDLLFLKKIIEIADNVVSVQPVEWLQNPVNHNKKSSKYNQLLSNGSIRKIKKELDLWTHNE